MFEGTLVESRGLVGSPTVRWTATCSLIVQCCVAGLLVALPMLRPESMKVLGRAPELVVPVAPKPPAPMVRIKVAESASAPDAMAAPVAEARVEGVRGTMRQLLPGNMDAEDPGPAVGMGLHMGTGVGAGPDLGLGVSGPKASVVRATPPGPARLSSGVSAGRLLTAIQPVYPPIAKAAGVQGTVVLEAVISKAGSIESVHAVSGPEMLRGAALDAVQRARYQPYKLNGQVVEVQTTITVNFRVGS